MNPELRKFLEEKMDEIRNEVKKYIQQAYGDIEIRQVEVEDRFTENDDGIKTRKIEIEVWTDKGYIDIEG